MRTLFIALFLIVFCNAAIAATRIWDGGGTDANWQTAANWSTDVAPTAGDDLVFPAAGLQQSNNNNFFLLTSFNSINIEGGTYTLGGNPIRLASGLTAATGTQTINLAITLSGAQTFSAGTGATATIVLLSVGSSALTIDSSGIVGIGLLSGSGPLLKQGPGAGAIVAAAGFNGSITLNDGLFIVDASLPNSSVSIESSAPTGTLALSGFGGTGTIGATTVTSGVISAGTLTSPTGILNISSGLAFTSNGAYVCKIGGTTPGTDGHDQLNVTGAVTLGNALLAPIAWNGFSPAIGDTFVIIRNDGADEVNGTFLNAPEGSVFAGPLNTAFQITYQGGDGNDVAIERVRRGQFDFDGDGRADISVFRPSSGFWYATLSGDDSFFAANFGLADDRLVPADFDGDNRTDIGVFRPADGKWYVLRSSDQSVEVTQFGQAGDTPVPADRDGDGRADVSVFRPSDGVWYQTSSLSGQFLSTQFGQAGDLPQIGDFDGDGITDISVFREGIWYFLMSSSGGSSFESFGLGSDIPVPADYDGDGTTDIAVYRDGDWYIRRSMLGDQGFTFGLATDVPAPADLDGDGSVDAAVFRNGAWYYQGTTSGFNAVNFGLKGDRPIPAAFR